MTLSQPQPRPNSKEENVHPSLRNTDIVILVTGPSGAGKSTFINTLLSKNRMPVGQKLTSCTESVDYDVLDPIPGHPTLQGRRLVLVDTPGFDGNNTDDTRVLRQIADWLELHSRDGITLGGVVYLHEISQSRFSSMGDYDLVLLRKSFGNSKDILRRLVIATSKWDRIALEEGSSRQRELVDKHWKALVVEGGSKARRFKGESQGGPALHERAWWIVDILLDRVSEDPAFEIRPRLANFLKDLSSNSKERKFPQSVLQLLLASFGRA